MPDQPAPAVTDACRLALLDRLMLVDSPAEATFDRLTRLASSMVGTPVALVSLVTGEGQFFKSQVGLPEPWASLRHTPLSHSFCQHVVGEGTPLVVDDAREHPELCTNLAVPELDVIAYAGIPLSVGGHCLGSFCVIDSAPRRWTRADLDLLTELAAAAEAHLDLRLALLEREQAEAARRASDRHYERLVGMMSEGLVMQDADGAIIEANPAAERILGLTTDQMAGRTSVDPRWQAIQENGRPLPAERHPAVVALTTGQSVRDFVMGVRSPTGRSRGSRPPASDCSRAPEQRRAPRSPRSPTSHVGASGNSGTTRCIASPPRWRVSGRPERCSS